MKRKNRRVLSIILIVTLIVGLAVFIKFFNGNYVYISTGLKKDELFKVGSRVGYTWEAQLLLSDMAADYEKIFGNDVWDKQMEGISLSDYVKDQVKSKLIRVKCMNNMAASKGIVLSRQQKEKVSNAADAYFYELPDTAVSKLGITKEDINNMFSEFMIASVLYDNIVEDCDVEVSLDEARVIKIQYMCSENESDMVNALRRLNEGESFYTVSKDYTSSDESGLELRRGQMDESFEEVAFNLSSGENSKVTLAGGKYYIIKCTSDNEKSKTSSNKQEILAQKKLDYFNEFFNSYESSLHVELDEKYLDKLSMADIIRVSPNFENSFRTCIN